MKSRNIDVIVLRGAPASGKSETAKCLARLFPTGAKVEVDTLRQMVISVNWKNQAEHINLLQLSTGLVHDFLKFGFRPVIVVDTFSGDKIKGFLDGLHQRDQTLSIKLFALYVSEDELRRRLELRSNGEFRDFEISKRINDDVLGIKFDAELQIDTTGNLPTQIAEVIFGQCKSLPSPRSGIMR